MGVNGICLQVIVTKLDDHNSNLFNVHAAST